MIVFETVRWKNFLSTGNTFTEINLNQEKTNLIIGKNLSLIHISEPTRH